MRKTSPLAILFVTLLFSLSSWAQYTPSAGKNAPAEAYEPVTADDGSYKRDKKGEVQYKTFKRAPTQDGHGNANGNQYDLAVDGAFKGQTVLILDQVGNTLVNTRAALATKGFNTVVFKGTPTAEELDEALAKSCQVWLISTSGPQLKDAHIASIKKFFDAGHGVYIWGDNDPLYADANRLGSALIKGLGMKGNLYGNKTVGIARKGNSGLAEDHLITTGLEHLYEGITIATIQFGQTQADKDIYNNGELAQQQRARKSKLPRGFTPIVYGSAGNLVTVAYQKDGKRLMMDGGFTRLAVSWDDAGTARYVKNAAAWLVNSERFGHTVARK